MRMSQPERYIQVKRTVKVELIVPDGVVQWEKFYIFKLLIVPLHAGTLIYLGGVGCSSGRNRPHLSACGVLFRGRVASRYELRTDCTDPPTRFA